MVKKTPGTNLMDIVPTPEEKQKAVEKKAMMDDKKNL